MEIIAKTIVEKLKLEKYDKAAVLDLPEGADYLADLANYETKLRNGNSYDLIFAFVLDLKSLKELITKVIEKNYLNKNGYIYVAYPKKGNKQYPTFIHRDDILTALDAAENGYAGSSNIKFSRMVGFR